MRTGAQTGARFTVLVVGWLLAACAPAPSQDGDDGSTVGDAAVVTGDGAATADATPGSDAMTPADAATAADTATTPDAGNPVDAGGAPDTGSTSAGSNGSGGTGGALGDSAGPCAGCRVHVPPGYQPGTPAPILVALHGDEGRDYGVDAATAAVVDAWRTAADARGFIVLALACPASEGCDGAWSDWLAAQSYQVSPASIAWAGRQVDAVEAAYNVDRGREYLAGWSGGAYWLGYYAQASAARFAGAAFVAGGMPAYTSYNGCPACSIPGYFLAGNMDPRTPQISDTANAFEQCGSTVVRDLFAGDHEQTIGSLTSAGRADTILDWFLARPLACR